MSPSPHYVRDLLLRQAGFLTEDGSNSPGLLDASQVKEHVGAHLRYATLFRGSPAEPSSADLIYESPGAGGGPATPCGFFTILADPSPANIANLRMRLWNHGRIPTLWVITPDSVRVYDTFARPIEQDIYDSDSHLLGELRVIGDQLTALHDFHRRNFDTAAFWHSGAGKHIDATQRVDQSLLTDLRETADLLQGSDLSPDAAHSLLRQTVFVKYLEDRGILQPEHFRAHGSVRSFRELLDDLDSTSTFLRWLHTTFNGDLFSRTPLHDAAVQQHHLAILQRFLSGHRMKGYPGTQARLWPYSFQFIPIELISSIYEMFAHSGQAQIAKAQSVHYTRVGLVELLLSLAMPDLTPYAKVLDPACGSGVFLVEAFRRLVWAQAERLGRDLNRRELHDVLRAQIFGMDIDRDAVSVAAFSLYLALLELDPDPQPLSDLRLPTLVDSPSEGSNPNLYVQDFLNPVHDFNQRRPFVDKDFDLIVSNPPWTAWTAATAPTDPDATNEARQWGLDYVRHHSIPDGKPDQAFMQRSRDFVGSTSRIAMVVGRRLLHQQSGLGQKWRKQFFDSNTVLTLVDLSDLVNAGLLFGSANSPRLPACIVVFTPRLPESTSKFTYLAPKRYSGLRSRDEILLNSSDIKQLPQDLARDNSFHWNAALRGTPRDIRLLFKLGGLQTLDALLSNVGITSGTHRARGVTLGKGPQRSAAGFQGLPFLEAGGLVQDVSVDVGDLPTFPFTTVAKRSNNLVLALPAMVLGRSLTNNKPTVAFIEATPDKTRLVIPQSYYGISFSPSTSWLAERLRVILRSSFTRYWTFMTGSELGSGRRLIEVSDWCRVPMPASIVDPESPIWSAAIRHARDLEVSQRRPGDVAVVENALDRAVYRLFDLSEQDITIIQDTIEHVLEPYLNNVLESDKPSAEEVRAYARRVCAQINGLLQPSGQAISATVLGLSDESALCACHFSLRPTSDQSSEVDVRSEGIDVILASISRELRQSITDRLHVQKDLRVYDEHGFWIIKPSQRRLWTEAAGLNDADLVVYEHLVTTRR